MGRKHHRRHKAPDLAPVNEKDHALIFLSKPVLLILILAAEEGESYVFLFEENNHGEIKFLAESRIITFSKQIEIRSTCVRMEKLSM